MKSPPAGLFAADVPLNLKLNILMACKRIQHVIVKMLVFLLGVCPTLKKVVMGSQ